MKSPVVGRCRRVVIGADRVTGTKSLPLKGIAQDLCKSAADLNKPAECALVSRRRRVDKNTDCGSCFCIDCRNDIDALANGACRIATINGDLSNQGMRQRMGEHVFGTPLVANVAIGDALSPLPTLLEPTVGAAIELPKPILCPGSPVSERVWLQSKEEPFSKLLNGRQPGWIACKRRASDGQPYVLKLVCNDRGGLEPRKAV
jgi:hypothetical protein